MLQTYRTFETEEPWFTRKRKISTAKSMVQFESDLNPIWIRFESGDGDTSDHQEHGVKTHAKQRTKICFGTSGRTRSGPSLKHHREKCFRCIGIVIKESVRLSVALFIACRLLSFPFLLWIPWSHSDRAVVIVIILRYTFKVFSIIHFKNTTQVGWKNCFYVVFLGKKLYSHSPFPARKKFSTLANWWVNLKKYTVPVMD